MRSSGRLCQKERVKRWARWLFSHPTFIVLKSMLCWIADPWFRWRRTAMFACGTLVKPLWQDSPYWRWDKDWEPSLLVLEWHSHMYSAIELPQLITSQGLLGDSVVWVLSGSCRSLTFLSLCMNGAGSHQFWQLLLSLMPCIVSPLLPLHQSGTFPYAT